MDDLKLYGGPGCGKTWSGIEWLLDRVEEGSDVRRVAFVSYTNAAVDEAVSRITERFDVDARDLPYSRTLHSLCKRALGITQNDWCADNHLKEFGREYGYDLVRAKRRAGEEGLDLEPGGAGADSALLAIWDFARHRMIFEPYEAYRTFGSYDPDATMMVLFGQFQRFVAHYEEWKKKAGLRDYTDLLLELVENPVSLPVSVALIDEAQDLSPLMWAAADALFAEAELRGTLGDDDQAIYSFSGADPALMNRRKAREVIKLRQSHRLPSKIIDTANWIINANDNREPKELLATTEGGTVDRAYLDSIPLTNGESWFLLIRNWKLIGQFTDHLEYKGIPYRISGGRYSPWSDQGPYRAAETLYTLGSGGLVSNADLHALAQKTPSAIGERPGVWKRGFKKEIETAAAEYPAREVGWRDLMPRGMTETAFARVMSRDLTLMDGKVSERDLTAYQAALRAGTWGMPVRICVGSIHSVKGKEAENVAVLMGCTGAAARAMYKPWRAEEERRVAYVGATRARQRLYGVPAYPDSGVYPWELMGV